ncbi:MAG TPA: LamG domain-containing protein, partial [Gammaproteobacteria bacterium]|nr:LamG domain-containing protein [Gammaproteobacteria bacterium]
MQPSGNLHSAKIPSASTMSDLEYYVEAKNSQNTRIATLPSDFAVAGPYLLQAKTMLKQQLLALQDNTLEFAVGLSVEVPAGAISTNTELQVKPAQIPTLPVGLTDAGIALGLTMADGTTSFSDSINLTFSYTAEDISGLNESDLRVYYLDLGNVRLAGGEVNTDSNYLSVGVDHFTDFFVAAGQEMAPVQPVSLLPQQLDQPLRIQASMIDYVPIKSATLFYRITDNLDTTWQSLLMVRSEAGILEAMIPASFVTEEGIDYYVQGKDGEIVVQSNVLSLGTSTDTKVETLAIKPSNITFGAFPVKTPRTVTLLLRNNSSSPIDVTVSTSDLNEVLSFSSTQVSLSPFAVNGEISLLTIEIEAETTGFIDGSVKIENQALDLSVSVPVTGRVFYPDQNYLLVSSGPDNYLELPADIFDALDAATVEGWVRWQDFDGQANMFTFGDAQQGMQVTIDAKAQMLNFQVAKSVDQVYLVESAAVVSPETWYHVAATSGPNGMKLYLNGELVGTDDYTGSFSGIGKGSPNRIGPMKGQIDEFRVWRLQRTQRQVLTDMQRSLEAGPTGLLPEALLGYWNFDSWTTDDLTTNGHDGVLKGDASISESPFPSETAPIAWRVTMRLKKGLNMISLPLEPDSGWSTARNMAEQMGATVVVEYDPNQGQGKFVPYIPELMADTQDPGFPVVSGRGYIVNVLQDWTLQIRGQPWGERVSPDEIYAAGTPAAPSIAETAAWAFVINGSLIDDPEYYLPHRDMSPSRAIIRNLNSGEVMETVPINNNFHFVLADLTRSAVVQVGDTFEITVFNDEAEKVSGPHRWQVEA